MYTSWPTRTIQTLVVAKPSGVGLDQIESTLAQERRPWLPPLRSPRGRSLSVSRVMLEDRIDHILRVHVSVAVAEERQAIRPRRLVIEAARTRRFMSLNGTRWRARKATSIRGGPGSAMSQSMTPTSWRERHTVFQAPKSP